MENENVYQRNGYANRKEYLKSMAEEFGIPFGVVKITADILGENEDFDGLLTELEELEDMYA